MADILAELNTNDSVSETKEPLNQNDVLEALKDDPSLEAEVAEEVEEIADNPDEAEEVADKPEEDEEDLEKAEIEPEDLEFEDIPKRQEILKAYPDIFKKFPGIEKAIHREAQFTNVFATPKEAEESKSRNEVFSRVEQDLFSGNIGNLLTSIKQQDGKAFTKIAGTFLTTLGNIDKESYFGILNGVVSQAIKGTYQQAKQIGGDEGEQLALAAQIMSKFLLNTADVDKLNPGQALPKVAEDDPEKKRLEEERKQFNQERLDTAVNDVRGKANKSIQSFVEKYIDPKGLMGDYVRNQAVKDVLSAVDKEIGEDKRFRQHLDRLWVDAYKSGYTEESKNQIRKAILKKAQSVLPGHIRNVRAIASKGISGKPGQKRARVDNDSEPETIRRTAPPRRESVSTPVNRSSGNGRPLGLRDVMKALE